MSNNAVVPAAFQGAAPSAVFSGVQTGDDMAGGITGGYGLIKYRGKVWAIQYHGNTMQLMRDDGDGPRGSIDVIVVRANPNLSKTWYENGWQEDSNAPPDCASADGLVPDNGVPKKQALTCAQCLRNQWGTAPNGGKGKACGDHRRMAVVPLADIANEALGGPLLLRCPAASLQDLAAFDARYKAMWYPYFSMGIKIGFDAQESFPKFTFNAIRPLTDDEARQVLAMRDSPEVKRVVNESHAQAPAAAAQPVQQGAFLEGGANQQPAQVIQQAVQQPVAQPAPQQPVAQPAQQPAQQQVIQPAQTTGFGATATVQPSQPAQQPVQQPVQQPAQQQQRPATQMTGFGATATPAGEQTQVTPAVTQPVQQPVQQQVQATQPVQPGEQIQQGTMPTASEFEGSLDDRLAKLIGQ